MNTDNNPLNDGVWDGVWADPMSVQNVSYDADPDGDGFNEAIWLDLGFPVQIRENPDGTVTKFVPMFAMTITDADALLNLNAHGNVYGVTAFNNAFGTFGPLGPGPDGQYGTPDDDLRYASQSNQGVAASEVNPQWGMTANTGEGPTAQHQRFYGNAPQSTIELANMEWWWLTAGRADLDATNNIQNLYEGRFGEVDQLNASIGSANPFQFPSAGSSFGLYPSPGNFNVSNPNHLLTDDNLTAQTGGTYNGLGILFPAALTFPSWQQPLDLHGSGRFTATMNRNNPSQAVLLGKKRLTSNAGQHIWPAYGNYQDTHEVGLYANASTRFLLPNYTLRYDVDEPEETILEPEYARSDYDSIYGAGEFATLHLAQPDQDILGLSGRLRDLAPLNFDGANVTQTEERRRRFTPASWDLKAFGMTSYNTGFAPNAARTWEFPTNGTFPPASALGLFRGPVQQLLRGEAPTNPNNLHNLNMRKLSINHLCDFDYPASAQPNVIFRPLTPHPAGLGPAPVNNQTGMTINSRPINISTPYDQEWFARRDRQQLARDIYTLLYLFGGGNDAMNYANTPNPYSTAPDLNGDNIPDILKDMAQFAVNAVDRMDQDNVVTMFEFDINLANGWNLDDDPYTNSTTSPTPGYPSTDAPNAGIASGQRGVVYGVEEQEMALNEAQIIFAKRVLEAGNPKNHDATEWDDSQNRDFTYIELENTSRQNVNFNNESWQIVVRPPATATTNSGSAITGEERRLTFTANHPGIPWGVNANYLVGTAGDNQNMGSPPGMSVVESEFRVNRNYKTGISDPMDPEYDSNPQASTTVRHQRISPRDGIDMDLILTNQSFYRINQPGGANNYGEGPKITSTPAGSDLFHLNEPPNGDDLSELDDRAQTLNVEIELRRRLNPLRQPVTTYTSNAMTHEQETRDNPWIIVDKVTVPLDVFTLNSTDQYMKIRAQLDTMRTIERQEPLIRQNSTGLVSKTPIPFIQTIPSPLTGHWVNNSLGYPNILGKPAYIPPGATYQQFTQYQPLFNREYGSAMELLSLPLYGPDDTTQYLAQSEYGPGGIGPAARPVIAANLFTNPQFPNTGQVETGNRWYRLFEFVEVPDRSHRHPELNAAGNLIREPFVQSVGNRFTNPERFYRRPGRINLNTLRHAEVLGGLLDDPEVVQLNLGNPNQFLPDQSAGTGSGSARDWWVQFVQARDGVDPVSGMILPGLPASSNPQFGSRPFLPFSYSADGVTSVQNTIFRTLPLDNGQPNPRTLFELGNQTQQVDHSVKYRMLEKVANNSTIRSNVFIMFIQVDFFQAVEVLDPNTGFNVARVGAKLTDSPGYRGFYVIDRSKARNVMSSQDFQYQSFTDPVDGNNKTNFSFDPNFDFNSLILHRQTIN